MNKNLIPIMVCLLISVPLIAQQNESPPVQANLYKLDSVIHSFMYDDDIYYTPSNKKLYTYEGKNCIEYRNLYNPFYTKNENLLDGGSERYVYDFRGNMIHKSHWNYDHNEKTDVNSYYAEFEYNTLNKRTMINSNYYNRTKNLFENSDRSKFYYSKEGLVDSMVNYDYDRSLKELYIGSKIIYTYNEVDLLVEENGFIWDNRVNSWVRNYRTEYTYNSSSNLSTEAGFKVLFGEEKADYLNEYTYGSLFNKLIREDFYRWDDQLNEMKSEYRNSYIYDNRERLIKKIRTNLNDDNDHIYKLEQVYSYVYEVRMSDLILPPDVTMSTDEIIALDFIDYAHMWNEGDEWIQGARVSYHYSGVDYNQILEPETGKPYPNAVTDKLTFPLLEEFSGFYIEIYNLQGGKVLAEEVNGVLEVNVSELPIGIYVYHLNIGSKVYKGKFVRQ